MANFLFDNFSKGRPSGRIPYLEGPLGMDKRVFDVAKSVVEHPALPGHQLPVDVYAACMVIEYLQRKLVRQQRGLEPGAYFVCPECRNDMRYDPAPDLWVCTSCMARITVASIKGAAHAGRMGMYIPSGGYTKKTNPDEYKPSLTRALPHDLEVAKLKQIHEEAAQEEEPVVMYRSWKLNVNSIDYDTGDLAPNPSPILTSINAIEWEPRHPLRAVHVPGGHTHDDKVPDVDDPDFDEWDDIQGGCPNWYCNCGIYGVKSLVQAQQWGKTIRPQNGGKPLAVVQVLGKVVFWGRVLMFETGAKAQFAYPERLWLSPTFLEWADMKNPDRLAEDLSARYGIPVNLEDGMFDLGLSHT